MREKLARFRQSHEIGALIDFLEAMAERVESIPAATAVAPIEERIATAAERQAEAMELMALQPQMLQRLQAAQGPAGALIQQLDQIPESLRPVVQQLAGVLGVKVDAPARPDPPAPIAEPAPAGEGGGKVLTLVADPETDTN